MSAELKGGSGLAAWAAQLREKFTNASVVEVGWHREATYPNGMPVAAVAVINEFGGSATIPEHEVTINRSLKADMSGDFNAGGRFVKASKSNYETTHVVPTHDITIPARPFFRATISAHKEEWMEMLRKRMSARNADAARVLRATGKQIKIDLENSIIEFHTPPNAPSTIARKGKDDPLIDSGQMLDTVDYEVK